MANFDIEFLKSGKKKCKDTEIKGVCGYYCKNFCSMTSFDIEFLKVAI